MGSLLASLTISWYDWRLLQKRPELILVKVKTRLVLGLLQAVDPLRKEVLDTSYDDFPIFNIFHMILIKQVVELLFQIGPKILGISVQWNTPRLRSFSFAALFLFALGGHFVIA